MTDPRLLYSDEPRVESLASMERREAWRQVRGWVAAHWPALTAAALVVFVAVVGAWGVGFAAGYELTAEERHEAAYTSGLLERCLSAGNRATTAGHRAAAYAASTQDVVASFLGSVPVERGTLVVGRVEP